VVLLREPVPARQVALLIVGLFVWCALAFSLLSRLDRFIAQALFAWFPAWAQPQNALGDPAQYSRGALALTLFLGLALNGVAGPAVEELYFRGYLLPRLPAARWWAPAINSVLFSLYHFFSPWQNVTRLLALLPLIYAVAWKRNLAIGLWTHCLLNTAAMLPLLALLFP
jgi:membrane protease YdiL (CAAX protease family)